MREALKAHRFVLLRHPRTLTLQDQRQLTFLLDNPVGPTLGTAYRFLRDWRALWHDEQGTKRDRDEAQARFLAWRSDAQFAALTPLKRVQGQMTADRFDHLSQFLRQPTWEATNNGAERSARVVRHRQGPHFNLRQPRTIEAALRGFMHQHRRALTAAAPRLAARCGRGRCVPLPPRLAA